MMKRLKQFYSQRWQISGLLFSLIILAVVVLWPSTASADLATTVSQITGGVVGGIVNFLGKLLILLMNLLIWIAQYNGFINSPAVTNGWTILRDICNMFFILILLVIAFATTLNRESYSMKKLLPKFIIAAVLINFSKLICGVIIDFAQIIMLTFVNGFRDIGAGNLADMLGVTKLLSIDLSNADAVNTASILSTYFLALLYVIIAGGVIAVIVFLLVMRIVMIWIYVVLSPLPYLLWVLPKTEKFASQWWQQFTEAVVSGPILAFFIWLSFASATIGSTGTDIIGVQQGSSTENEQKYLDQLNSTNVGLSEAGAADSALKFIISIGLLIGGVMVTKQAGGQIGQIAGKFSDKMQRGGLNFAKARGAAGAAIMGKAASRTAIGGAGLATKYSGIGLNKLGESRLGKSAFGKYTGIGAVTRGVGTSLKSGGQFMTDWRKDLKETRIKEKTDKRKKTLEKLGMKETSLKSLEEAAKTPLARGVKGAATVGAGLLAGGNPYLMGAGAAQLAAALPGKWLAGKMKNFAVNRQKKKDLKQAEAQMNEFDTQKRDESVEGMENLRNSRKEKIANYKSEEEREVGEQKEKNERAMNEALDSGMPKADLDNLKKDHDKSLDDIAKKYSALRDQAEEEYRKDALSLDKKLDEKYKDKTTAAGQAYDLASRTIKRDTEINEANNLKEVEMKRIQDQRKKEVAEARTKYSSSPLARDLELKKINTKYDAQESMANDSHKDILRMIGDDYGDIPQTTELRGINKTVGSAIKKANEYEPNKLTISAAQLGTKEWKESEQLVKALGAGGGLRQTDASAYSGLTGLSGKQEKFFETLSKNDENAKNAIDAMIKDLKAMQNEGIDLPKGKKDMIEALKRGVAMFKKKKPDTAAAFSTLTSELDNTNMAEGKRVDDYTPKD